MRSAVATAAAAAGLAAHLATAALPPPPTFHSPNYWCKQATEPWPVCRPVNEGAQYRLTDFPIHAWAGPYGYWTTGCTYESDAYPLKLYAEAFLNVVQLSDRTPTRLDFNSSWAFLNDGLALARSLGLQVILDTWGPLVRTYNGITGGHFAGGSNTYGNASAGPSTLFKKVTPPELAWLAPELVAQYDHVVGVLLTDDGVDLASDEVAMAQWMRNATPQLVAYVNECQNGAEWLPRSRIPWYVPELYGISPLRFNLPSVVDQAASQLVNYDISYDAAARFGLTFSPLFMVGDNGTINGVTDVMDSASLGAFQANGAIAYGAGGLLWYCWSFGLFNITSNSTFEPVYSTARATNAAITAWGDDLLAYSQLAAVYHTGLPAGPPGGPDGTGSYTQAPGDGIVAAMDEPLMVGIRLRPANASARTAGAAWPRRDPRPLPAYHGFGDAAVPDAVAVVVDKRVEWGSGPPPPARNVTVTFGPLIAAVEVVGVNLPAMDAARLARAAAPDGATRPWSEWIAAAGGRTSRLVVADADAGAGATVTLTLTGGQGALLRLYAVNGSTFDATARGLRPWRYRPTAADLGSLRVAQYSFYNYYYQAFPSTPMPLGIVDLGDLAAVVGGSTGDDEVDCAVDVDAVVEPAAPTMGALAQRLAGWLQAVAPPPAATLPRRPSKSTAPTCRRSRSLDGDIAARLGAGDPAAVMRVLSSVGFNAYVAPGTLGTGEDDAFYGLLNAALNNGAALLASPPAAAGATDAERAQQLQLRGASRGRSATAPAQPVWSSGDAGQAVEVYGCHPNFGGLWLTGAPGDAANATAGLPAASAVRFSGSHLFTPAPVTDVRAVTALAAAPLPLAPLTVPGAAGLPAMLSQYAALLTAASTSGGSVIAPFSPWVLVDACAPGAGETAASLTFRATAALAYGAKALWWTGTARCAAAANGSALLDALALLGQQVAGPPGWGQQLLAASVAALYASDPTAVPGSVAPGPGHLVTGLGPHTLAAVLTQPGGTQPPLVLLVDTSCVSAPGGCAPDGVPLTATATLDAASVAGWGVQETDQTAGFTSCGKTVVGHDVSVTLSPGGAELVLLTMLW